MEKYGYRCAAINRGRKIGSFLISAGVLSRPNDFWTFKVLVTALSSSMEKGTNTNRQLPPTRENTQLVGDCLGVPISIFNFSNYIKS